MMTHLLQCYTQDLHEEIDQECSKYGTVENVIIYQVWSRQQSFPHYTARRSRTNPRMPLSPSRFSWSSRKTWTPRRPRTPSTEGTAEEASKEEAAKKAAKDTVEKTTLDTYSSFLKVLRGPYDHRLYLRPGAVQSTRLHRDVVDRHYSEGLNSVEEHTLYLSVTCIQQCNSEIWQFSDVDSL